MIIPVKVKKRVITCKKFLIEDNIDTYSMLFTLDEEWDSFFKEVIFYNTTMPSNDTNPISVKLPETNTVEIPWEVLQQEGSLQLTVRGTKPNSNEVIITKYMDTAITVYKAGLHEGSGGVEPTPSTIQLILTTSEEAMQLAQSVKDDADSGKFNGAQANIKVGETTTGEAGTNAAVSSEYDKATNTTKLDFTIPRGYNGKDYVLTDQDKEDIASLSRIGLMKVYTSDNDEDSLALIDNILSDVQNNMPALFLVKYDAAESLGLSEGSGMMFIGSDTGDPEDTYLIPYIASELPFTSEDQTRINTAWDITDKIPQGALWKGIVYLSSSAGMYTDGTYMSSYPLREFRASIDLTFPPDLISNNYLITTISLSGVRGSVFRVNQDIIDLGTVTLKIHCILIDTGYLFTYTFFKNNILILQEEVVYTAGIGFDKKGSQVCTLLANKEVSTVNYVYGRS